MTGGIRSREWEDCKQGQGMAEGAGGGGFKDREWLGGIGVREWWRVRLRVG